MLQNSQDANTDSEYNLARRRVLQVAGVGIGSAVFSVIPSGAQETVDFGDVALGSSTEQTVSQPNPAEQPLQITEVSITGSDADQFSVMSDDTPVTVEPGESHSVDIQFVPTSTGEKSATVQVEIAGSSTRTAGQLTGTGVETATDTSTSEDVDTSDSGADDSDTDDSDTDNTSTNSSDTNDSSADDSGTDEPSSSPDEATASESVSDGGDNSPDDTSRSERKDETDESATQTSSGDNSSTGGMTDGSMEEGTTEDPC